MTLEIGDQVPPIVANNQDGDETEIDLDGPTVVYFYPEDQTSGCTTEARQFEHERETYDAAGVDIYGVSTDDVDSHAEFCAAEGLTFDLLADADATLAETFDVSMRGGRTARTTFVILDGEIYAVYEGVNPDGHAREVLGDLLDDGVVNLPDIP